jgi:glycosyltransferase A (GT-A) superfamily protein (DUF2064 family)
MANIRLNSTALILFTRSQQEEAKAKDFSEVHSLRSNSQIAGHLISHAEKTARRSGLPCFVINSNLQHGNTFGEKLSDAFQQIFVLGFDDVIAIGNDCPSLTARDLTSAALQLKNTKAVLGPSADGGLYLIGLNKSAFNASSFAELPWGTSLVSDILQSYLRSLSFQYLLTEVKEDIDFGKQLSAILNFNTIDFKLRAILRSIIDSIGNRSGKQFQHPVALNHRIYTSLRAPPAL